MAARQYGRMRDERNVPVSAITPYSEEVLAGKLSPELDAGELSLPMQRGSPALRQYPVAGYPEARNSGGQRIVAAKAWAKPYHGNPCPRYGVIPGGCNPNVYPRMSTPESRFITQPYISPKSQGRGRPANQGVIPLELTWRYEPMPFSSPASQTGIRLSNAVIPPKYHEMHDYNMLLHQGYEADVEEVRRMKGYR